MANDSAVEAPAQSSRWEDLVDVFFSPGELFRRRASDPWWRPFLLLCALSIVLYYVFLPINAVMWEAMMMENAPANADPAQLQQGAQFMKYLGGIFVPFGYIFMIGFTALGLKLASAMLEPSAKWGQAFTISTYAAFVVIPQQILATVMIYLKSQSGTVTTSDASFGVLRFMEKPDAVLQAVLGRLDLFPIWTAVLCAVGLVVIVGMPRGKALIAALIGWLFVALPGLAAAALRGAS